MANTIFKYHQHPHHQHQPQPHNHPHQGYGGGSGIATIDGGGSSFIGGSTSGVSGNHNQNNSNQNSIFVLNAETKISPNSCRKFYLDFNDNSVDSTSTLTQSAACNGATGTASSASSVWSSASSTMCSPAAHAIQKLFNCSSGSTSKHQGNYNAGIDSKSSFKTPKSELLKKKSKFWQYLEGETGYEGIDSKKGQGKSRKHKSKYWPKSNGNDNQNNHNDLSELLEYSCSLCDNCRCMDCQIGYFDCDNSDDSNSEYSFHMNAYEEDDDIERGMELKSAITATGTTSTTTCDGGGGGHEEQENLNSLHTLGCNKMDNKNTIQEFEFESSTRRARSQTEANHGLDECCHQCYGLEVEQHCLDFHQLYSEYGDQRNH